MGDPQSMIVMLFAGLLVLFVPGLVWATLIAGLYGMIKERVAEFQVTSRQKLTPAEERLTNYK